MNLKKLLIVTGLALSVGAGVGAVIAGNVLQKMENNTIQAHAADTYYYRGTIGGANHWNDGSSGYSISNNGAALILDLTEGDKFLITPDATVWDDKITSASGDAVGHGINAEGGDKDIYVAETNTYALWMVDGALKIDFGVYYYSGDANGWDITTDGSDTDHPAVRMNGSAVTWSLSANDKFKIRNNNWDYGVFGYSALKDGDFYGSFTNDNGDVKVNIEGLYDVSVFKVTRSSDWVIRIVPHDVHPDDTAFAYVLDKYGNLLNTNHRAFTFINGGQAMSWPGAWMGNYTGTTHMYQIEFWTGMEMIIFNSNDGDGKGGAQSIDLDVSASGENSHRGKCLIIDGSVDGEGKWSSNTWVWPQTAKFIENCLHFANHNEDYKGEGECISEGWYDTAVSAYNALDEVYQREVCTIPEVVARLQAWAAAQTTKHQFVISDGIGAFSMDNTVSPLYGINGDGTQTMIIVAMAAIFGIGVGGFFLLRRKEN